MTASQELVFLYSVNLSLEELIAQRASVAQHLAWIDAKIAHLNAERVAQASQSYQQQSLQPQPESSTKVKPMPVVTKSVTVTAPIPAEAEASPGGSAPLDPEIEMHMSPSPGISNSDKMGCIIMVTVVSIIAFLLLIGAGYLWRKAHPKEPTTESQYAEPAR